jgi:hypothetical protein
MFSSNPSSRKSAGLTRVKSSSPEGFVFENSPPPENSIEFSPEELSKAAKDLTEVIEEMSENLDEASASVGQKKVGAVTASTASQDDSTTENEAISILQNRWLRHLSLQEDYSDPPGIKVRPMKGKGNEKKPGLLSL